jgi:hypothetical protein
MPDEAPVTQTREPFMGASVAPALAPRGPSGTTGIIDREHTERIDLCQPDGTLDPDAIGWSRRPLHVANLSGPRLRHKLWEYFCVTTETHVLSMTFADLGYLGLVECSFLDVANQDLRTHVVPVPFAAGFRQPDTVGGGDIHFRGAGLRLAMREVPGGTHLSASSTLPFGRGFEADVLLSMPEGHETLSVVVPWSARRFQLTCKQQCRPAEGSVRAGGRSYEFSAANRAFGCLDFGRGYWPYATRWNWGSASGHVGDRVLGLNLGGQWTDGTGTTENAVVVDGRLHRVTEPVTFLYDRTDWKRPWHVRSPGGSVNLRFEPVFERSAAVSLGLLSTEVHQCFGYYDGTVEAHGERHRIDRLFGWAEEHRARW